MLAREFRGNGFPGRKVTVEYSCLNPKCDSLEKILLNISPHAGESARPEGNIS